MKTPDLILEPTIMAQWHALVSKAEGESAIALNVELESYLVFLLMRFIDQPEIAKSILAMEFLQTVIGQPPSTQLQAVGDKCLLYSGLFAEQAERRHVQISYFVYLGQSAYATLAGHTFKLRAELYHSLSDSFVKLMDVLQTIRAMNNPHFLMPLQAIELWKDTGSQYALKAAKKTTGGFIVAEQFKNSKPIN